MRRNFSFRFLLLESVCVCVVGYSCVMAESVGAEKEASAMLRGHVYTGNLDALKTSLHEIRIPPEMYSILLFDAQSVEIVEYLVAKGGDVKTLDQDRRTLLMLAAQNGNSDLVKLYLNMAIDINGKDNYGRSALYFAAGNTSDVVAEILIRNGAYIDVQTSSGVTPLMFAAQEGAADVFEFLIAHSANTHILDHKKKDIYHYIMRERAYKSIDEIERMKDALGKREESGVRESGVSPSQ